MSAEYAMSTLAPQMADYDRLAGKVDWRPYLMFFQQPNFTSTTVTTDRFGFRATLDPSGARLTLDDVAAEPVNLLVGNSVAFGVGASADGKALASRLAAHTGERWVNFCGRAFGSTQELILFQSYRHKLGPVRRVLLCTGLNDLYLFYAPKLFDETFGIFFFSEVFHRVMNDSQVAMTRKREIMAGLLRPFYGERIDYARVPLGRLLGQMIDPPPLPRAAEVDLDALVAERRLERGRIVEQIGRTLELWSVLARGIGFHLTYALQPMLPWVGKEMSREERELLAAQDAGNTRWHRILRGVLDRDHYEWYADALRQLCARFKIDFLDMNPGLRHDGRWLYIDRVHLNDAGQDVLAEGLARVLAQSLME